MAEDQGQGSGGSSGEEGQQGQQQGESKPPWGDNFDAERAWTTIQRQREAEQAAKREAAELKARLDKLEAANLSEAEKVQRRAEAAEQRAQELDGQLRTERLNGRIVTEAAALGFRNPNLAGRLVDPRDVQYDEDGQPKNLSTLLKAVLRQEPYLGTGGGGGEGGEGQGAGSRVQGSMNDLIRQTAGRQ